MSSYRELKSFSDETAMWIEKATNVCLDNFKGNKDKAISILKELHSIQKKLDSFDEDVNKILTDNIK